MGRPIVEFELSNYRDIHDAEEGRITPDKIRKITMTGVVDTGAARLVLPAGVAQFLGLPSDGESIVRYADHHRERRAMAKDAFIRLEGRTGVFKAILEPARTDALLGAIVMEDLDLLVDCTNLRVFRRDPDTVITEVE